MDRFAPKGMVWVCTACGKISPNDRHGDRKSDRWWDVSCVLNSVLVKTENLIKNQSGKVVEILKVENS